MIIGICRIDFDVGCSLNVAPTQWGFTIFGCLATGIVSNVTVSASEKVHFLAGDTPSLR